MSPRISPDTREPAALYMVDTSSFTELRRTYPRPPFDNVWKLIERLADEGRLISIDLVLDELNAQDDEVSAWAKERSDLFLELDEAIQLRTKEVLAQFPNLVDLKRKKSSADPFLIAAAIVKGAVVVTQEKPSGGPPAVKIPNVCSALKVRCIPLLTLIQEEGL